MDKYDASNDHYCYPGSSVLRNKLAITDATTLELAERDITNLTIDHIHYSSPPYSLHYLCQLHRALFSELYDWAGKIRTVDITKGGTRFCHCSRIVPETNKLFDKLSQTNWLRGLSRSLFCAALAEYYCEFNMIHPFREGNGRIQRLFFEHLTLCAGYEIDWADVTATEWIQANIAGANVNYHAMTAIFLRIVSVPRMD